MTETEKAKSPKKQAIALVLAVLLGIIGFLGTGYLYLGRIGRGIIFLIAGWVVIGINIFCISAWSMLQLVVPPHGEPMDAPTASWVFLMVSIALSLIYLALWVWQIINTRSVFRKIYGGG